VNPWDDPQGAGFQIIQSFLALGSGGLFGRGLGESKQKLFYLPEPYTDFIQTRVTLGVVTGALPTKGLPLPFVSFGGSALLMTMFSAGVLLNISQHATGGATWDEAPAHV
jgi:cell division protein FtsW